MFTCSTCKLYKHVSLTTDITKREEKLGKCHVQLYIAVIEYKIKNINPSHLLSLRYKVCRSEQ